MPTKAQLSYREKLRLPQWQKKRLEVMLRDNFSCVRCGDNKISLNVHHKSYEWGKEPWDYPLENFETLCEPCHENHHSPKEEVRKPISIYLAGKIAKNGWRDTIVKGLRGHGMGSCGDVTPYEEPPGILEGAIFGEHHYTGPFFLSCDHGCFHGRRTHGAMPSREFTVSPGDRFTAQIHAWSRCMKAIRESDMLFAWLETNDCHGTLAEIGFAKGLGKYVQVVRKDGVKLDELWFASLCSTLPDFRSDNPESALKITIEDYYKYMSMSEDLT